MARFSVPSDDDDDITIDEPSEIQNAVEQPAHDDYPEALMRTSNLFRSLEDSEEAFLTRPLGSSAQGVTSTSGRQSEESGARKLVQANGLSEAQATAETSLAALTSNGAPAGSVTLFSGVSAPKSLDPAARYSPFSLQRTNKVAPPAPLKRRRLKHITTSLSTLYDITTTRRTLSWGPSGELITSQRTGIVVIQRPLQRPLKDVDISRKLVNIIQSPANSALKTCADIDGLSAQERLVYQLGHILFELFLPGQTSIVDGRRELSQCLEKVILERYPSGSDLESLLRSHQLESACELAIKEGDPVLASLIAQAGTADSRFCENIKAHIQRHPDTHEGLQIVKIIAGQIIRDADSDFLQNFALYAWYCSPIDETVVSLVRRFDSWYDTRDDDVIHLLLRLYVTLQVQVDAPSEADLPDKTIQSAVALFTRLKNSRCAWTLSWLLDRFLGSSQDIAGSLARSYAAELEQNGLHAESTYVLSQQQTSHYENKNMAPF